MVQEVLQDSLLQEANLPLPIQLMALATLVIWTLFSTAFPPWLLVSAPVPPLQDTGTVAHVPRWWVQLAFLPDRFLVLIHALGMQTVMPITRGELEQSGNK